MFDSSVTMAEAAARGLGVALLPAMMLGEAMKRKRLFKAEVSLGGYWITSLRSKRPTAATEAFRAWLLSEAAKVKRRMKPSGPPPRARTHLQPVRGRQGPG